MVGPRRGVVADKTYELISFLTDIMNVTSVPASFDGSITYHDSCSGLREMCVKEQPRALLTSIDGVTITEGEETETCCGFGGLFCVKYPDISEKMVDTKINDVIATGADTLLAGDLGCLMNIAGRIQRRGLDIKVRHTAEVLADMSDAPAIGEPLDKA